MHKNSITLKIRESKYFYDSKEYGSPPTKGDLTKTEQWLNTGGGNPTASYRYDDYGNLIEQIDPLGRLTKYEYGLTDITSTYPERITNALGHSTTYAYDIFGSVLTNPRMEYDDSDFPTYQIYLLHPTATSSVLW